jgi:hypothetical protein
MSAGGHHVLHPPSLPQLSEQVDRLIELGVHELGGLSSAELAAAAADDVEGAVLAVRPERVPPSQLAPLLTRDGKNGFVVIDMTDVDQFSSIDEAAAPDSPLYLVRDVDRGDSMCGWSPEEALPAIIAARRSPLTLTEGIYWLLQQPEALERNHCFVTIGSRLRKPVKRLDARTPAIWISNGTGRDGRPNRGAPKVGWCWAGNRHTWLGFASAARRSRLSD